MKLLLLFVTVLVVACNSNKLPRYSYKDSVIQEYFRYHDSLGIDTSEDNYKMLKAYLGDSTQFFKELQRREVIKKQINHGRQAEDSFVHQAKLADMDIDEGFRFIYGRAFSRVQHYLTLTKKRDSIKLYYVEYGRLSDTLNVKQIFKDYKKILTPAKWDDFKYALDNADLWGLKEDNGVHGLDGDYVMVYGYKKAGTDNDSPKYTFVYRWSVGLNLVTALRMLFDYAGAEMR